MPEPINTTAAAGASLMTLAVALVGPQAGPYIVILLGSIAGGLWALSSARLDTRMQGAWLLLRCVTTAIVLTAVIAGLLSSYLSLETGEAYAVVSFIIGALGNRWQDIFESIKTRLQGVIASGGKQP
jgi:hypothetical protein